MKDLIAICGLNCETCDARIATLNNDDALREKTAKLWSKLNGVPFTPEMINCTGCRTEGVKTPFCDLICPIRKCAKSKDFATCGNCPEIERCETVGMVHKTDAEAKIRLTEMAQNADEMIQSRCGLRCSECSFKEAVGCKGCTETEKPFWGECPVKSCCETKELQHCGECGNFVCAQLHTFAYDTEQSDNGARIEQCKKWRKE